MCLGGEGKERKKRKHTEEFSSSGEEGSDEDRPKKRGRPPLSNRERIKGFTDVEIRRFVKSYKKFAAPLKRLDAVAGDAELQEKPLAELKKLGEMLHERCLAFMGEHVASKENNEQPVQEDSAGMRSKKRARGPSFKLGGVSVNAKTMMACEQELLPLDEIMPSVTEERYKWVLEPRTKPAHFDTEWTNVEDSKLLLGIYQYGMGSWEAIKMDPSLGISEKILSNDDVKPQAKHLQSRAEYLLKVLKRQLDTKKGVTKPKRQRKPKETKALTKEIIEHDSSPEDNANSNLSTNSHLHPSQKKITIVKLPIKTTRSEEEHEDSLSAADIKIDKKEKKKAKKEKKKRPEAGPMHFTANNEPRALDVLGDLDPSIFNEVFKFYFC